MNDQMNQEKSYPPWNLISSEPDILADMINRYGVKDITVQDVLTLDNLTDLSKVTTYGIILAYQYSKEQLPDNIEDKDPDAEKIIFTSQLIVNSCATIGILNILSNIDIEKGDIIQNFLDYTKDFNPINRGLALGGIEEITSIHNSYNIDETTEEEESLNKGSAPENSQDSMRQATHGDSQDSQESTSGDVYHFISYIFKNGFIWELDGLKRQPYKIQQVSENENWLELLKPILTKKVVSNNIEANILAVVKNPIPVKEETLNCLIDYREKLSTELEKETLQNTEPSSTSSVPPLSSKGRILLQKRKELDERIEVLKGDISRDKQEVENRFSKVDKIETEYIPSIAEMVGTINDLGLNPQHFQYPFSSDHTLQQGASISHRIKLGTKATRENTKLNVPPSGTLKKTAFKKQRGKKTTHTLSRAQRAERKERTNRDQQGEEAKQASSSGTKKKIPKKREHDSGDDQTETSRHSASKSRYNLRR